MQGRERLLRYYGEWFELFDDIRHEIVARHSTRRCGRRRQPSRSL
jgi:hypothetical protein